MQENTLRRGVISDEDVRCAMEDTGRGWVVVGGEGPDARVLAFVIARRRPAKTPCWK